MGTKTLMNFAKGTAVLFLLTAGLYGFSPSDKATAEERMRTGGHATI